MVRTNRGGAARSGGRGPSQRQLRAGELIRRALADILAREDLRDPALAGKSITVTEVRVSPDLKHATAFVVPLGGGTAEGSEVAQHLGKHRRFLRGQLAKEVTFKFLPDLHFEADSSFEEADHVERLLRSDKVAQDLGKDPAAGDGSDGEAD